MQQSTQLSPSKAFLKRLVCFLRIRHVLFLVLGLLSFIAISAITWNGIGVIQQFDQAKKLDYSNAIAEQALSLNARLAQERGLTATILANHALLAANKPKLNELRRQSAEGLNRLHATITLAALEIKVASIKNTLNQVSSLLTNLRARADQTMDNHRDGLSYREWIEQLTEVIERIAIIDHQVSVPFKEEEHAIRYGVMAKQAFFSLSENLGLERALISVAIAQQKPIDSQIRKQLESFFHANRLMDKHIREILNYFPPTAEIIDAKKNYQQRYIQDYYTLRKHILANSDTKQPYPLNPVQWFEQATLAVDSVLQLAKAVHAHMNQDIRFIKSQSQKTVFLLITTCALVFVVFIAAFTLTYQRILTPLRELEHSAKTIAKGNFSRVTQIMSNDEFGQAADAFEVMRDYLFSDRERREQAEQQLLKLSKAVEQSVSSIVITDVEGITEYVNPRFEKNTGYFANEVIGKKFNVLQSGNTDRTIYKNLWDTIKQGKIWQGEICNRKKSGELYWDLVSISPVSDKNGSISHYIGVQHDISERKQMEQQLSYMAYHDELTNLPNRTLLFDRFSQYVGQAKRDNTKVALMLLDLDHFKYINDSLGHPVGDKLLQQVAQKLKKCARETDTIARYGGDEFVILVSAFHQENILPTFARRFMQALSQPHNVGEHQLRVSSSIGISLWPDDGLDIDTLLKQADSAMYHAKALGRDQFQFFTDALNRESEERLLMENELREALQREQLELYFQPKLYLKSQKIIGAEALIRWNHPKMGIVSPIKFIPLAEQINLILPIGNWVLQQACEQIARWQHEGIEHFSLAVNVSPRQLDNPEFVTFLSKLIEDTQIHPLHLEIEITESAVMVNPNEMLARLQAIKTLGVQLALDDFGTGYSSLSYLRQFPFDRVKIDRSFIKDVTHNPDDAAIARSIIQMAHDLNMSVIAEGVETEIQSAYMSRYHCDQIQGYLLSRPIPLTDFEQLWQLHNHQTERSQLLKNELPTVLIVDDEPAVRNAIRRIIRQPWLTIVEADNSDEALNQLALSSVHVIVADYNMPGIDGMELLNRVRDLYPQIKRIAISGKVDIDTLVQAINRQTIHRFFPKPWNDDELKDEILSFFSEHSLS